jgi:hypothetical protein
MTVLALVTVEGNSVGFEGTERGIANTRELDLPNNHLIKVTACWRSMSSTDAGDRVTLSITDDKNVHLQEQSHLIAAKKIGLNGGQMSTVLKVRAGEGQGDITPGSHLFKLRAVRVGGTSKGTVVIQADKNGPVEILVEDLGEIPNHDL